MQDSLTRLGGDRPVLQPSARIITLLNKQYDIVELADFLRQDYVLHITQCSLSEAETVLRMIAEQFGLIDQLELQAEFADFQGHRRRMSRYFMSVNARIEGQIVTPHSEGTSLTLMQLASFYCMNNTTDGGHTVLLNVDDEATGWGSLRELTTTVAPGVRPLTSGEASRLKTLYRVSASPAVRDSTEILTRYKSDIPDVDLADVLAPLTRSYSTILAKDTYAYWDSVASVDYSCIDEFIRYLSMDGLLMGLGDADATLLDSASPRRRWSSHTCFGDLFKGRANLKLTAGDLVIQNNLSWTHGVSNWTPGSGQRNVIAAFA